MQKEGPGLEEVDKIKQNLLKNFHEKLSKKDNDYWAVLIETLLVYGVDLNTHYEEIVNAVTPAMVQQFAKEIFGSGNLAEVVMDP
jgi:zinc protease